MKNLIPSYVRVPLIFAIVFAGMEFFIDSGDRPAFIKYPMVALFLGVLLFLLIAIEIVISAVDRITYQLLTEEQKKQLEEAQSASFTESKFYKSLTRSKSIEQEADVMLDHDYDGIKELDNVLPPWWVWLFYGCIIFSVIYLVRFHVVGDYTQEEEYKMAMLAAEKEHEEYLKTAPDLVNVDNVELLIDAGSIAEGKKIFNESCIACHGVNLQGGIGPNLVDAHWINGGGVKNIFRIISEGSTNNPVMAPWKEVIQPTNIQKVASYIVSLQGSNPEGAKEPEGEIWKENIATTSAPIVNEEIVVDSLTTK